MSYKVGDKLVCKLFFDDSNGGIFESDKVFIEGYTYSILAINKDGKCTKIGNNDFFIRVTDRIVNEYFCTIRHYRKIKLEQLVIIMNK